jgi:protein tyrosine phosphatase (PTP) superfamily phosphohydrolase (DUF442 family)
MQPLDEIQDFLEITPDLLTAGQPFEEQLLLIQAAGCDVVINLATQISPEYIQDEAARVNALGLDYIAIPVDWTSPQPQDLADYFSALQKYRGRMVFAHCARNMRVSAFTYLYRVLVLGLDPVECRKELETIWQPNEIWAQFISDRLAEHNRPK